MGVTPDFRLCFPHPVQSPDTGNEAKSQFALRSSHQAFLFFGCFDSSVCCWRARGLKGPPRCGPCGLERAQIVAAAVAPRKRETTAPFHRRLAAFAPAAHARKASVTCRERYGLGRNRTSVGRSPSRTVKCPDVAIIRIGGERFRTAWASFIPFMEPGMSISVNTTSISSRVSSRRMASPAFEASTTSKPAFLIISTASMRGNTQHGR